MQKCVFVCLRACVLACVLECASVCVSAWREGGPRLRSAGQKIFATETVAALKAQVDLQANSNSNSSALAESSHYRDLSSQAIRPVARSRRSQRSNPTRTFRSNTGRCGIPSRYQESESTKRYQEPGGHQVSCGARGALPWSPRSRAEGRSLLSHQKKSDVFKKGRDYRDYCSWSSRDYRIISLPDFCSQDPGEVLEGVEETFNGFLKLRLGGWCPKDSRHKQIPDGAICNLVKSKFVIL